VVFVVLRALSIGSLQMAVKEGRRAQENEQLPRKNQTIKEIYIIIKNRIL
jgi:hypothetical protein